MTKKCEKCGKWLKNMRGYNIHCNRMHKQEVNIIGNIDLIEPMNVEELLDRMQKLELDNTFIKIQLKHKTIIGNSKDSELDWDIPKEIKEAIDESEIKFNVVVKELKVIFTGDNFNYHNILSPINPIEEPISPPIMVEVM